MARSSIGLDIGTRAVRLAEVRSGSSGPELVRFGRMLLPDGAVDHGEVTDPFAVASTITSLWKRLGLQGKGVHVGVSNRRVIVRTIEVPMMSRDDLKSAIRFQAQEHIPIPLDEAVMDYEVLDEVDGANGEKMQRVLVVAAERGMIEPLLAAVRSANLELASLELNAYPLVRCFGNGAQGAEAIVDIGAGVTNVVVHQGGKIRFTRILPSFGGDEFTSVVAEALNVDKTEAETLKRRASRLLADRARNLVPVGASAAPRSRVPVAPGAPSAPNVPAFVPGGPHDSGVGSHDVSSVDVLSPPTTEESPLDHLAHVIEPLMDRFVTEVRGSLDFYAGLAGVAPVERVVLTGGGALLGGIAEELNAALGVPVELGHPFKRVPIGAVEVSPEERAVAEPFIGLAVGLAMAGMGA
jgi:type IV pilus assembly protein PilM